MDRLGSRSTCWKIRWRFPLGLTGKKVTDFEWTATAFNAKQELWIWFCSEGWSSKNECSRKGSPGELCSFTEAMAATLVRWAFDVSVKWNSCCPSSPTKSVLFGGDMKADGCRHLSRFLFHLTRRTRSIDWSHCPRLGLPLPVDNTGKHYYKVGGPILGFDGSMLRRPGFRNAPSIDRSDGSIVSAASPACGWTNLLQPIEILPTRAVHPIASAAAAAGATCYTAQDSPPSWTLRAALRILAWPSLWDRRNNSPTVRKLFSLL